MNPAFSGAHSNVIFMEKNGSKVVYEKNGIQILAFDVCHEPVSPDFGYRINYQSKSVVQSADLLIHEAMLMDVMKRIGQIQKEAGNIRLGKIMTDVLEYHTSPLEAAEVAAEAGVKELVLHHLGPTPDNFLIKRLYLKGLEDYFQGPVHLADDGDQFTIE